MTPTTATPHQESDVTRPTAIEVCCGSAGLSASLRKAGIQIFAVDHQANRHCTKVRPLVLDLTENGDQEVFKQLCNDTKPDYIHMGLPCGTCSRAREKPLPRHLSHMKPPRPLRSQDHLMGLNDLNSYDKIKVEKSNALYKFAVWILLFCFRHSVIVSVENPVRSWLWQILAKLVKEQNDEAFASWYAALQATVFAACQHGGARDKRTKLLATPNTFTVLEAECKKDHKHASWQPFLSNSRLEFPTAQEAEYPTLLCDRMAQCVVQHLQKQGKRWAIDASLQTLLKRQVGIQTVKTPQLIAEFSHFAHLEKQCQQDDHKLIAAPLSQGDNSTEQQTKRQRTFYKYGVLRSPEQFLKEALKLEHPIDGASVLHDNTKDAISFVVDNDPVQVAKQRMNFIIAVKQWRKDLAEEERKLKRSLNKSVASRHESKNILLFKKLLEFTGFEDMDVVNLLLKGVPLVGCQEPPKGFKLQTVPATMTTSELEKSAVWRRKAMMSSLKSMPTEDQEELMKATSEEVSSGFLVGPFGEDDMTKHFGTPDWLLNPRFVLYQGEARKVRVIDDAKASSLNAAYTSTVKLELQDVDYISAMVCQLMSAAHHSRHVKDQAWLGKTFDLSKAYKQMAVQEDHQHLSVVGFQHKGRWLFYKSVALPFGATGSVYSFVRMSRAIWHILCKGLHAVASHYFDDFPTIECAGGAKVLSLPIESLMDELGWQYAKEGVKALSFSEAFDALGVTFKLDRLHLGNLTLQNKAGRIEKICSILEAIMSKGRISPSEASEVQGLLNFASGFFVTRSLRHLISAFHPLADSSQHQRELVKLCRYTIGVLKCLGPRLHKLTDERRPVVIFTDAAWEDGRATAGLVLCDLVKNVRHCRQIVVPKCLVDHWTENGVEQIISQIELFALLATRLSYRDLLLNRRCVCWIDNEAARFAAIKSSSSSLTMRSMARCLCELEIKFPSFIWIERVPSFSNPADMPSRLKVREASHLMNLDEIEPLLISDAFAQSLIKLRDDPYSSLTRGTQSEL